MVRALWSCVGLLALALSSPLFAAGTQPTRSQALQSLVHASPVARLAAVERLGKIGTPADVDRLLARLDDTDETVRLYANASIWQIWGRSGDRAIDALYSRGVHQMEMSELEQAVDTFSEIIRRKPAFAEAWNKRATIYFLQGNYGRSMKDCQEVLKRIPNHFGALSGSGQIQLEQGNIEQAIVYFERALKVNPNMPGAAVNLQLLRRQLQEKLDKTV